ncbi:MAG: hypothetical protein V4724_39505, partial [Pseudomonadota bacterium]
IQPSLFINPVLQLVLETAIYMKIQSLFSVLKNILAKEEITQISLEEKMMRSLSSAEVVAVAGGPELENDPPSA